MWYVSSCQALQAIADGFNASRCTVEAKSVCSGPAVRDSLTVITQCLSEHSVEPDVQALGFAALAAVFEAAGTNPSTAPSFLQKNGLALIRHALEAFAVSPACLLLLMFVVRRL